MNRIAIIGGGAAGLMAAATIVEMAEANGQIFDDGSAKVEVLLFEKNSYLGAKVLISGGGRCNTTTGIFDVRKLLENYPRGAKFLMSAMFRFPPEKVMEWFEKHGVKMKIEDDLRVFPTSNEGKDVVGALENVIKRKDPDGADGANAESVSAQIFLNCIVEKIEKKEAGFKISLKDGRQFNAEKVIITTGGNAYRNTGSTGDGYAFAKALRHSITKLAPSLHSFLAKEAWLANVAGVSFKKAKITLSADVMEYTSGIAKAGVEKRSAANYERTGPFVFTHRGVSGPAIFALSSMAAYENFSVEKPLKIKINLFPDEKPDELKKRFNTMADQNGKKFLVNFLDFFLPKSLAEVFCEIAKIDPKIIMGQLNGAQREAILKLFQNLELNAVGRGAGDEFVTAGGVDLREVNTNTMESKICPGLYFAGEILDVDGFTGGFNLQAAWATGRLAGENIINYK